MYTKYTLQVIILLYLSYYFMKLNIQAYQNFTTSCDDNVTLSGHSFRIKTEYSLFGIDDHRRRCVHIIEGQENI